MWCEPAKRRSTWTKPQHGLLWPASTRRPPRRASQPGCRCASTHATYATAGTSPESLFKAGSRHGTATPPGFDPGAPHIFSNGPLKSSQGHAGEGSNHAAGPDIKTLRPPNSDSYRELSTSTSCVTPRLVRHERYDHACSRPLHVVPHQSSARRCQSHGASHADGHLGGRPLIADAVPLHHGCVPRLKMDED